MFVFGVVGTAAWWGGTVEARSVPCCARHGKLRGSVRICFKFRNRIIFTFFTFFRDSESNINLYSDRIRYFEYRGKKIFTCRTFRTNKCSRVSCEVIC